MPLDRSRDLELKGRGAHTLYRRLGLGALGLVVIAALLNVFGQRSTTTVAAGDAASLSVDAPSHLRGGLVYEARFEIEAKRPLKHTKLVLSRGWMEGMTLNTVAPTPLSEASSAGGLSMNFEPLAAGGTLIVWTQWQVNPTNVARRGADVALRDGPTPIATVDRTVTVFP